MSHFAKVKDGIVLDVIVAEQDFIDQLPNIDNGVWIQTSYNTLAGTHTLGGEPLRMNFAAIGGNYDEEADAFYAAQPYPSWTLNTDNYTWEAPVACPTDGEYVWDEETTSWVAVPTET